MANHSIDNNFGGIIQAFNSVRTETGLDPKNYPSSFEGVVAAILELGRNLAGALPSPYPPGWDPILDDDGNPVSGNFPPGYTPPQGDLWFDTRQGRLMIWIDDAYYQTNGADVLTRVQTTAPDSEVTGALWYDPNVDALYIWDGTAWRLVTTTTFSSATLPLNNSETFSLDPATALPSTTGVSTQSAFNIWAVSALSTLETNAGTGNTTITVSDTEPTESSEGDLWFNTSTSQLFVDYDSSWVPTTVPSVQQSSFIQLQTDVNTLESNINTDIAATNSRVGILENTDHKVYNLELNSSPLGIKLANQIGGETNVAFTARNGISVTNEYNQLTFDGSQLQTQLTAIQADYLTSVDKTALENTAAQLQQQITAVDNKATVTPAELAAVSTEVAALPTFTDVNSKLPLTGGQLTGELNLNTYKIRSLGAPVDPSDAARLADITNALVTVSNLYIPQNNPVFNGIDVQRNDIAVSGIKFVNGSASGIRAIELGTNVNTNTTAVFGQTSYPGEVAWTFNGGENFSWIDDTTGKQLRVNASGVCAKNLSIGNFVRAADGTETLTNEINVKDKLNAHDTALATHTQQINDIVSTTHTTSSVVVYSDAAPTGSIENGTLWFDSYNIRLNVRHQGAWIYPDRVEDTALKASLLNAVNTSTDYTSLKTNLIAALS